MHQDKVIFQKKTQDRSIQVYSDADCAGSRPDIKSTTSYDTYVWGNLVTWRSKKQLVVSISSAEAEFIGSNIRHLWRIMDKESARGLGVSYYIAISIYCDNLSTISMTGNPVQHDNSKHVKIDRHFFCIYKI